ncbi:YxiJ family protein [Bacillus sp. FSL H8-0547]
MRKELINKLKILSDTELKNAFPYEDIGQMEEYFDDKLSDEHSLTGDFNEFIMLIAGSASYVLSNKEVPKYQMHFLDKDFFSLYPHYSFFRGSVNKYPEFHKELLSFEKARLLLLEIVK